MYMSQTERKHKRTILVYCPLYSSTCYRFEADWRIWRTVCFFIIYGQDRWRWKDRNVICKRVHFWDE